MFDVEEVNGGKNLMGNDTYCEITAIGKIRIVNPTAKRNLI